MPTKRPDIAALVFLFLLIFTAPARADGPAIGWNKLSDAVGLSDAQKELALSVFKEANCYAGCSDTVYQCLLDEPDEPAVRRIANFLLRRVKAQPSKERVLADLKDRAISVYPPKTVKVDVSQSPGLGKPDAPIRIAAFADGECPYCRIASPALRKIATEKPEWVQYHFKHFPIKNHAHGLPCATAMAAAHWQGKFWEYHDLLYKTLRFEETDLEGYAKTLGLDLERFRKDRKDPKLMEEIGRDKMEGVSLGIVGTPGIFINGKFYRGLKTYEELWDRIEEERDIIEGRQ